MNNLNIFDCNAGHLDQYNNGTVENAGVGNVASVLYTKIKGGLVHSYDGKIAFGERFGLGNVMELEIMSRD